MITEIPKRWRDGGYRERDLRVMLANSSKFPPSTVVFVEPVAGLPVGQPDVLVAVGGNYVPVELKQNEYRPELLRPAQRKWHMEAYVNRIPTFVFTIHQDSTLHLHRMGWRQRSMFETSCAADRLSLRTFSSMVGKIMRSTEDYEWRKVDRRRRRDNPSLNSAP